MDKPRKSEIECTFAHKRRGPIEVSENESRDSEDREVYDTPKSKRKVLSKEYKKRSKGRSYKRSGTKSTLTMTPSPCQRPELNLSPIVKLKLSAAELFNSAALSENVYDRENEKSLFYTYLSPENTDSRTLYICGPPGVGKTATLNHVLNTLSEKDPIKIYSYNGMHYKDAKEFLNSLDERLCKKINITHCPSYSINTLIFSIQTCLKTLDRFSIIIIDEIDAFLGAGKEAIKAIFHVPLYAPKTVLVGIANSSAFHSNILEYYEKHPTHKVMQVPFEPYKDSEIQSILKAKLAAHLGPDRKFDEIITGDALRNIAQNIALGSGDMRAAFDVVKTALLRHVNDGIEEPVGMQEVAGIIKSKYMSKLGKILKTLPVSQQMLSAAIYTKAQVDHREVFKYREIFEKLGAMVGQLGLGRPQFGDFCEGVKMLEFYGVLKGDTNPKPGYASKLKVCVTEMELRVALNEINFFKEYLLDNSEEDSDSIVIQ